MLGFELIYGSHTGRNIGQTLVCVLHKHGVENQLYTVTTENASNNSVASAYVKGFCANPSAAILLLIILRLPLDITSFF